eukprot:Gregarina_sp_Pseudo_9__2351@NODE_265_length_3358_cov_208_164206_g248_i0_p1_GENE_NODE_265_length_3358_cov_208_164206_g248_i0NODE_265_length_3358_cov_208_164206_g248_i0_p1_ORF_typecomplete_len376_score7_25DHHC/PF01529_20/2_7e03DHHC/PF01529_20/1_4e26Adeno_E1A/PF02703_14/0_46DUF4405/PF14358_6/36DUF4405/PF14358_6/5_9_NODE_265_length_3358_cov_208_164206_g248_i021433270
MSGNLVYVVVATWLSIVGGLSCVFLLAVIGPQSENPGVIFFYKWCIGKPFSLIQPFLWRLFGPRLADVWDYVVNKPNPIVQIFYLLMLIGGYGAFIFTGFPLFDSNVTISPIHRWTSLALSSTCLILFTGLSTSNPGFVRSPEIAASLLPIFPPNPSTLSSTNCRTCKFVRPGRSKHCRICGFCCCKYDHHCIWVNNCIGLLNWRLFMVFLSANLGLCVYGTIFIPRMLFAEIDRLRLREAVYLVNGVKQRVTKGLLLEWVLSHHTTLFSLAIACTIFGILLLAFVIYHLYLHFWLRKTTNEFLKGLTGDTRTVDEKSQSVLEAVYQDALPLQWMKTMKDLCPPAAPPSRKTSLRRVSDKSCRPRRNSKSQVVQS